MNKERFDKISKASQIIHGGFSVAFSTTLIVLAFLSKNITAKIVMSLIAIVILAIGLRSLKRALSVVKKDRVVSTAREDRIIKEE